MAEQSGISWTDSTFNPWIGCTEVSTGPKGACNNCYAREDNKRRKWVAGWGPGAPRKRTVPGYWQQARRWQKQHPAFLAEHGRRQRLFCASLADVFDNEVPQEWREDLWALIRETPDLWWLILSKRIGNAAKMLPKDWGDGYPNVVLGATIVTQEEWDRDWPKLARTPARLRFVSDEPTLDFIDIGSSRRKLGEPYTQPDWIITGMESGAERRPANLDHARHMRDQCLPRGIAYHHKQNGGLRGKDTGCLLDGMEHKAFPQALAA